MQNSECYVWTKDVEGTDVSVCVCDPARMGRFLSLSHQTVFTSYILFCYQYAHGSSNDIGRYIPYNNDAPFSVCNGVHFFYSVAFSRSYAVAMCIVEDGQR